MTCAFYSIVYDIVFLIERKINYFILFFILIAIFDNFFFPAVQFLNFVRQTLDPDPDLDTDPHWHKCSFLIGKRLQGGSDVLPDVGGE
jgi:hypothetical protein